MKILVNISHPAHVHLFKNTIRELMESDHELKVLSRKREVLTELLDAYKIPHTPISERGASTVSLATEMVVREFRALLACLSFCPDIVISRLDMTAIHAAQLTGADSIIFHDTEVASKIAKMNLPFIDQIHTPAELEADFGSKHERYNSYQELAYLHPNRFSADRERLEAEGVRTDEPYFVLRFVGWDAHHDRSESGLSLEMKHEIVDFLSERGDVFITSEAALPTALEQYRLDIPPHLIHDLLYFADLYVGDSQAMAAEAAILGTPTVRSNSFCGEDDMSKFVELEEKYELMYSLASEKKSFKTIERLCTEPGIQEQWEKRRQRLFEEKIDLTQYLLNIIKAETKTE